MARFWFFGGAADYTITTGADVTIGVVTGKQAVVVGGQQITAWTAETGGDQIVDLVDDQGTAVSAVTSSDGASVRALGQIPSAQGPDGVREMWASAAGGPRVYAQGRLAEEVAATSAQATQTASALTAHVEAGNPHAMASSDLIDWSDATPEDGQVGLYRSDEGRYVPTTVQGLNPGDFVSIDGGSEIVIPAGDITTRALVVRVPPGNRASAVNTYEVWWNGGTEAAPSWQLVTRLNEYGEFRGQPSRFDRVFGRVKQAGPTQTGNLWEFTDWANNPLSWVDAVGRMRAPNLGISHTWYQEVGTAGVGSYRFYNPTGGPLILRSFVVSAGGTAPAGGDYLVNPKLDGAAVYASANRPKITAGQRTSGPATTLSTTTWPAGSYLTVDVDTVPTTPPTKISIQVLAY